nr:hypothetical protein [Streptomyces sp. DSM 41633]
RSADRVLNALSVPLRDCGAHTETHTEMIEVKVAAVATPAPAREVTASQPKAAGIRLAKAHTLMMRLKFARQSLWDISTWRSS